MNLNFSVYFLEHNVVNQHGMCQLPYQELHMLMVITVLIYRALIRSEQPSLI